MSNLRFWKQFNQPKPYKPIERRIINRNIVPAVQRKVLPGANIIGTPLDARAQPANPIKDSFSKKEEKQMKEVYDKVILNGGKKKTAEEKIMDQVINGK